MPKESFREKHKFSILASILIILSVSAPVAYSAVQPHILLTMDLGQTLNPFEIKDSLGNNIFEIKPDGTYTNQGRYALFVDQVANVTTGVHPTNDSSNPIILKRWNVSGNQLADNVSGISQAMVYSSYLTGVCEHKTGVGQSRVAVAESDDNGATWNTWSSTGCSGVSGSWTLSDIQYAVNFEMSKELTDIAFLLYTNGASQEVVWREISGQLMINFPSGVTITEAP